jgi:CHAT domain-containing protein/Tfp pilus assembly protein PilF
MSFRLTLALLALLAACGREQLSPEQLRESAYQALERGDLQQAQSWAERGQKAAADARQPHEDWVFRVIQAEILSAQRKSAEALSVLNQGLERFRASDSVRVRALMTRGVTLCRTSQEADFRLAIADLEQADRIARSLGHRQLVAEVSLRRGTCLILRRDLEAAEASFRETLDLARRDHFAMIEVHATGSLGLLRILSDRYDEAAEWLLRALSRATTTDAKAARAKILQNLGWCYYKLGDFERALTFLSQAEQLTSSLQLTGDRLQALTNLGNSFYRLGQLDRAGERYDLALAAAREIGDQPMSAQLLTNLGAIAFEQGRYGDAESLFQRAMDSHVHLKDEAGRLSTLVNQGHVWSARGLTVKAEQTYNRVLASTADAELVWEAHSGLASLYVKAGRSPEADEQFHRAFAVMERSRDRIGIAEHRISFVSSLRRFHNEYIEFLLDAGEVEKALAVADRGRARLLAESLRHPRGERAPERTSFRSLAGALDAVLIFYWTAPRRSFVWAVTAEDVVMRVLPSDSEIRARVEAHQARIQRSRDLLVDDVNGPAQWLHRQLVGPIQDLVPPGTRLLLVPDGPLHHLNFETLIVSDDRPHYWIEDVTLAVAPSLGLLGEVMGGGPREPSILIIGDPVPQGDEFPALPHAAREVASIAGLFGPARATVRTQAEARPDSYAAAVPERFAFIHFAAHATANRESPLDSAVVLSTWQGAYKLYARDIVGLRLTAELVTLSACRSAGSRTYAGEGLVGLAWAFLGSGARNVIGGLWNVEDASTGKLMETLYRGVRDGADPIAALRAAKLTLLRSNTAHRKPFYWAPFMAYTRGW